MLFPIKLLDDCTMLYNAKLCLLHLAACIIMLDQLLGHIMRTRYYNSLAAFGSSVLKTVVFHHFFDLCHAGSLN